MLLVSSVILAILVGRDVVQYLSRDPRRNR